MSAIAGEIVEPYASALMSLAQSRNLTEEFGNEIRSLLELLENSAELKNFLDNPVIKPQDKKAVLQRITGDQVNPLLRNFLMLLVDRGRILFLQGIGQQYLVLLRKLNQTVLAEITSAHPLTEAQQNTLTEKVKAMTNARSVEISTTLDPDLLGGVIIKVGSRVVDASLRGQLRRIGMKLAQ
ncbi:ATP synthase subunit delta [Planktothrix tepida]|uniref:ATP synthase subunit delta n=2 Tax=Planktothrix TaxID=54304 RepID=A0A1J1LUM1_9CYAN|nr:MULTISPECIES: ATP synthase F1 subunit delta [Planktothrix]MBD2481991.1 F0F1 ATP synthase subunit delta [Planktothrix sp. FACHB-1365]CAD5933699.1 ATP synthase subunit delta [Planktothrix pseudagardhii]CAD5976351.1 ATP synthase subunit delta [Planktothrix tepida]CUR35894.1 ATP synthase subunit delta [Planktothrix tepida PCC 9214]